MLDLCVSLQKGIRRCGGRSTGHTCGALKKRLRGDAAMLRCRHDSSSSLGPCPGVGRICSSLGGHAPVHPDGQTPGS